MGTVENLQMYCQVKANLEEQKDFLKFNRQEMSKISINSTKYEDLVNFLQQIPDLIKVENGKVKPQSLKKLKPIPKPTLKPKLRLKSKSRKPRSKKQKKVMILIVRPNSS